MFRIDSKVGAQLWFPEGGEKLVKVSRRAVGATALACCVWAADITSFPKVLSLV